MIKDFKFVEKLIIFYIGEYVTMGNHFKSKMIRGLNGSYKYKKYFSEIDYNTRGIEIINSENEYPDFEFIKNKILKDNFLENGNILFINSNLNTFFDLRSVLNCCIDRIKYSKEKIDIDENILDSFFNVGLFNFYIMPLNLNCILNYKEFNTTNGIKRLCKDLSLILDLINYVKHFYSISKISYNLNTYPNRFNIFFNKLIKDAKNIIYINE